MRKNIADIRVDMREREEQNVFLKKEQEKLIQTENDIRQLRHSWNNLVTQRAAVINIIASIQNFPAATRLAQKMEDSFPQHKSAYIDANLGKLQASIVTEYDLIAENLKDNAKKIRDLHDELRFISKNSRKKKGVI